jgi:flagellar basal-body rod modification protein FlgD
MEITPTTTTQPTTPITSEAATDAALIASDFDTFLQLLTAQLENQDPTKPMESTEFVSQLASFSAVEQQVKSNENLESILGALNGDRLLSLANWVGKEVQVEASAQFSGEAIDVAVVGDSSADAAQMIVKDANGSVVYRELVEPSAKAHQWDGTLTENEVAENGFYSFEFEYYKDGSIQSTQQGAVFAEVKEVRLAGSTTYALLGGGEQVDISTVTSLRAAS